MSPVTLTRHDDAAPAPELIELALKLAGIERQTWEAKLAELRARGILLNAGDDDDDDDKAKAKGDKDDDDDDQGRRRKAGDKDDDDDDDDDDEVAKARKALAAANREVKRLKDEAAKADSQAKKDAGKYKELYEEAQAELDKLKSEVTTNAKRALAEAALKAEGFKNPAKAVKLIELDEVEDDGDARRLARKLAKEEPYMLDKPPTRQKRGAGGKDDDDDDGGGDDKTKKPSVSRLRRGLEASAK